MNYKRRKSRKNVRCRGCTDNRDYIGSDRQQRKREWYLEIETYLNKNNIHNGVEQSGSSSAS